MQGRIAALERAQAFSEVKRAMLALVEGGEPEALEALLPRLLRTENVNLLGLVGREAVSRWGESVISRLELESASDLEKENALRLCRLEGGALAQAMLVEGLRDGSRELRITAAGLLGEVPQRSPLTFEALEKAAVTDAEPSVRRAAARSLAETNDPAALAILERILVQTQDEKIEDVLIDLRLRIIERLHPGLIPPREGKEGQPGETPKVELRTMGRLEFEVRRAADAVREAGKVAAGLVAGSVRSGPGRGSVSFWRLAACFGASALLAFAVFRSVDVWRQVHPRPEQSVYVCPLCGAREEKVLGPGAKCGRCGKYVFADGGPNQSVIATSAPE